MMGECVKSIMMGVCVKSIMMSVGPLLAGVLSSVGGLSSCLACFRLLARLSQTLAAVCPSIA